MASELVRELIEAGVHFGHRTSRWNPKMQPFIFGKRNLIYIIDIRETVRGLLLAKKFLSAVVSRGQDVLFVGTKRPARDAIKAQAQRCGMPYVCERWLGGTLTNFRTIRSRLSRLEELESLESTGKIHEYSKKMISTLQRQRRRIFRNLEGIRKMTRLPGALFLVDVSHEHIAVKEARKLGIPTVCLVDTDGDPNLVDVVVPGNDDAMRAISVVARHVADAIEEGKRSRPADWKPPPEAGPEAAEGGERGERGGRRRRGRGDRGDRGGRGERGEREGRAARGGPQTATETEPPVAAPAAPEPSGPGESMGDTTPSDSSAGVAT